MSAQNLAESAVHARIRERLNSEGIKLWEKPFYDAPHELPKDEEIMALGSRYSTELELQEGEVIQCLYALQRNAIERLAEREAFQSTGMATIRLRLSGFPADKVMQGPEPGGPSNRIQVNLKDTTGRQIKERIATILSVPSSGLKLICGGKVISENVPLELQNVRNGSQLMVLSVAGKYEGMMDISLADKVRECLSIKEVTTASDFVQKTLTKTQIQRLADGEYDALTDSLALHEKGRSFLKLLHFSEALVFLLEADTAYNNCRPKYRARFDQLGLLNLDVAWCYLNLQSIAELPQVEQRLRRCELALKKSYGEDMEHVMTLKGIPTWEAALYVRLHLLLGITSYHLGQVARATFYLERADQEVKRLKVRYSNWAAEIVQGFGEEDLRAGQYYIDLMMDQETNYLGQFHGLLPSMEGVLLGMGNPLLDISALADLPFLKKHGVDQPGIATNLDDKYVPMYEEMMKKYKVEYSAGGAVQNSLRTVQWVLKKPNVTTFMGAVGTDENGEILEKAAVTDGVNVRYQKLAAYPTGKCAVLITGTNRSLVPFLDAATHFEKGFLGKEENRVLVEKAKYYYVSGFFLAVSPDSVLEIAQHASTQNKVFTMNLSATIVSEDFKDSLALVVPFIDILFGNSDEAQAFSKAYGFGVTDLCEIAKKIVALPKENKQRPRMVIITQGDKGPVIVAQDSGVQTFPIITLPQEKIVDTTGAGDAFVGGFLAQYIERKRVEKCVKCGVWMATEIVQQSGCNFPKDKEYEPI